MVVVQPLPKLGQTYKVGDHRWTCIAIVQILNRYLLQNTALEKEKNVPIVYY
jgi:hypothetical protein